MFLIILQVQFHEGMDTMAKEMAQYGCLGYGVLDLRPVCSTAPILSCQHATLHMHMLVYSAMVCIS